jgi:uncharacterized protein (TIGR03435 family)
MRRFTRLILVLMSTVLTATSRAQVPRDPAFDVAAIKPTADITVFSYSHVEPGGRYLGQNMSLRLLIKTGYGVHDNQIIGVPSWIDSDRWDINAKAEGYKEPMAFRDVSRLMVRPLLADRFKLVMHHELRRLPVYALVVAKPNGELGPNLRRDEHCDPLGKPIEPVEGAAEPSGEMACGADGFNPRHLWARSMTLNYLLIGLRRTAIDRVVVDRTRLGGKFDWEVQWVPDDLGVDAAKRPDGPSIFQAFRDQLGLKLEPARERVDVLVIDHVERPTPD